METCSVRPLIVILLLVLVIRCSGCKAQCLTLAERFVFAVMLGQSAEN